MEIAGFEQEDRGLQEVVLCGATFSVDVCKVILQFDAIDDGGELNVKYEKAKDIIKECGGPDVSTAACMAFFKAMNETYDELKKNTVLATDDTQESPTGSPEPETPSS